jgi:HK97 family phage major capsid protein/HK97 family phage prohead protease
MTKQKPTSLKPLERSFRLLPAADEQPVVDIATRTVRFPFSSEEPIDMWFGTEILSHSKGAIRLNDVRQQTMPLLFNHDMDDLLGVVESVEIGTDARLYATVRFGKDERGEWAMQQVADRVLINVSFMYRVFKYEEDTKTDIYTATDWEPYEVSFVTVPADASVGMGRAASGEENSVEITQRTPEAPTTTASATTEEGNTMNKRHTLREQANDGTAGSAGAGLSTNDIARVQVEARTAAIADERARVLEITAMCRAHKLDDTFRDSLINGSPDIASARGIVLAEISKRGEQKPLNSLSSEIGLTDAEQRGFSLMRAVNAALNGNWKEAGFEREVSDAIAKRNGRQTEGTRFFVPSDLPYAPTKEHARALRMMNAQRNQRAIYSTSVAGQGGNLLETDLLAESFIEVLRNMTVISQLGATYLPGLVGNVDIPRQISATSAYWVGESGALTESEATFDKVSLRPKTVGALSKISRLMLLQSTPAIEMLARRDLMNVGAIALDLAALSGSGTGNQPTGIVNQAGVASVVGGTNGANLTFDHLIALKYATKTANAPQANAAYAMNSKSVGYLSSQKSSTGQYLWDPQGGLTAGSPDKVKGSPYAESQQLRSNLTKGTSSGICSELIYGNFAEVLIGEWGIMEFAVNPYDSTGFANGDVILRMFQTIDIGVRHGASFAAMSDALTPGF